MTSERSKARFEKYGHKINLRASNQTEVFKPLKFKAETDEFVKLDEQFEDDVDSVQHFLENACVITQFDTD